MDISSKKPLNTESLLFETYFKDFPGPTLPFHLQLLYQEGMRANHLLFSGADQSKFSLGKDEAHFSNLKPLEKKLVIKDFLALFMCSDLSSMKEVISTQNEKIRYHFFILYKSFLGNWNRFVKSQLH